MMQDYDASAAALFAGGWRSDDMGELISEYELSEEDAEKICRLLAEYEKRNAKPE